MSFTILLFYCSCLFFLSASRCGHGYSFQQERLSSKILADWTHALQEHNNNANNSSSVMNDAFLFHKLATMVYLEKHGIDSKSISSGVSASDKQRATAISPSIPYKRVHLMRVPKASSTSLSVVARRLVGCEPPGPCCKYPGDPPGTCPNIHLFDCQFQHKVIGCTGHHGNNIALRTSSVKSIMIIRHPIHRSLSAFHYPGIHHNSDCRREKWICFQEYLQSLTWSNVVVKMLVGDYAYATVDTCYNTSVTTSFSNSNSSNRCSHSLEIAEQNLYRLHFIGIAEMWELSMLILHLKFPQLQPLLEEFAMTSFSSSSGSTSSSVPSTYATGGQDSSSGVTGQVEKVSRLLMPKKVGSLISTSSTVQDGTTNQRVNYDSAYRRFAEEARKRYKQELVKQNELDLIVYSTVVAMLCKELQVIGLWEMDYIRSYWKRRMTDYHSTPICF